MQKVQPVGEKNTNRTAAIIQGLKENRCPSDGEIRWILQHRETVIGPLLNILEETARWTSLPKGRPDAPTHAIFLLAALEASEAWGSLETILRKDFEGFVDRFFGDIVTECLPWAVARMAIDETGALIRLAEDTGLNTRMRNCGLRALAIQALLWPDNKKRVLRCFRRWLRGVHLDSDPEWATHLATSLADLGGPEELHAEIHDLFEQGLVEPFVIAEEDVYGFPKIHEAQRSIFDIYRCYGWMIAWQDPKIGGQRRRKLTT
jgi:hypothetical protein